MVKRVRVPPREVDRIMREFNENLVKHTGTIAGSAESIIIDTLFELLDHLASEEEAKIREAEEEFNRGAR